MFVKRIVTVVLITLLVLSSLWARGLTSLALSTGNDAISLGLGNNQDDGKSFSVRTQTWWDESIGIGAEVTSHTDQKVSKHRYDTLDLFAIYRLSIPFESGWSVTLAPSLGTTLIGSFGLEDAQTLLHSFKKKKPVILPVSTSELAIHPGFGLTASLHRRLGLSDYALSVVTDHRLGWESEIDLALYYEGGKTVSLSGGFHYTKGWSGFPTQYMQEERYNGFYLSSTYDGSLLFTAYRYYLHSGFSYGYIGFDPLAFSRPKTFRSSDLTTIHGLFYESDFNPLRLTAIGKGPLFFEIFYSSGPIADDYRHNIARYSLNYQQAIAANSRYLRPIIELGAGFKRYNVVKAFDTTVVEEIRPAVTIGIGVDLGPKDMWLIANTAYGVRLGLYLTHILGVDTLPATIEAYSRHTKATVLLFGISLVIDHDLSAP